MFLLSKSIYDTTAEDINRLIEHGVEESKVLEYKAELKIDSDGEKKNFLADVTAMANTDGGIIICGLKEKKDKKDGQNTGTVNEITGIAENKDGLIRKIEDIVFGGTNPRVNLVPRFIPIEGKEVLLIGIRKFDTLPHMITFQSSNRFYKRKNSGNYLVDTNELNDMFMNNFTINERIKTFVSERIAEVRQGNIFPEPTVETTGAFFMHVIPINHINENMIDLTSSTNKNFLSLSILPMGGSNPGINLEGFYTYSKNNGQIYSYQQVFRNGSIEFYTLGFSKMDANHCPINVIAIDTLEVTVFETITRYIEVYQYFHIEPPYVVFINLRNVEKCSLYGSGLQLGTSPFRRQHIQLPTSFIATADVDIWAAMRPVFDILWQACGRQGSLNYGDDGSRLRV